MKSARGIASLLLLLAGALTAPAESWRTLQGGGVEGKLSGVYGNLAVISTKNGTSRIAINQLDDASLGQVADFLAASTAPAKWSATDSKVGRALAKRLMQLQGGKLVSYEPGARVEPEFYVIYFGAYWCGPCRSFSPRLVTEYTRMKGHSPDRFEVIFVSDDVDAGGQLDYAREVNMPWPILKFSACGKVPVLDQWRGNGIPCLVVLNRDGESIYHSYNGKEYLGPDDPLEKLDALLQATRDASSALPSPDLHRLAIARHLRAAAGADRAPQAYLASLGPNRPWKLPADLRAHVTIDAKGHVRDIEFSPQPEAVTGDQLTRIASDWLFLPWVKGGRATEGVVEIPIQVSSR